MSEIFNSAMIAETMNNGVSNVTGSDSVVTENYTNVVQHGIKIDMLGIERTIEGVPPLTFRSKGAALVDYRIYGNMTSTAVCGDITKNRFDKDNAVFSGLYPSSETGTVANTTSGKYLSIIVPCEPSTAYVWSFEKIVPELRNRVAGYDEYPIEGMTCEFLDREIDSPPGSTRTVQKFTTTANTHWLILMVTGTGQTAETLTEDVAENAQLEIGTEMTSYEPYGYKIPISVNGQTNNIYIGSEPLRKTLSSVEAVDTISYSAQQLIRRVSNSGSALSDPIVTAIELPNIPTIKGLNTIDVMTNLKPSDMYIKYKG